MRQAINRQDLLAGLFLLLLPLLLFWPVTLGPYTLLPLDNLFTFEPWLSFRDEIGVGLPQNQLLSDLVLENYVWKKFTLQTLAAGQLPLWNPYLFAGQPFLANGQHSALYPFTLLFYLLPLPKAYGWFTVSQLGLAGLNMYIFLRVLRASRLGALVAGITYSLSGFFVVSVVFTMVIAGAAWLPLLLACLEMVIRKQEEKGPSPYSPVPYIVTGAGVLGIQALAGHVEITYYSLLVSGFYAGCRLLVLWRRQATPRFALVLSGWLLSLMLLGLGLGATQLVPMYEVVSQNFRDDSATLEQVRGWALPPRRLISFFIPDFFGSPAHHGYFDVVTRRWEPLGLNAHGEINPLCPHCTGWDTKTSVEAGAYVGILPLLLAGVAVYYAIIRPIGRLEGWRTGGLEGWRIAPLSSPPPLQPCNPRLRSGPACQISVLIFTTLALFSLLFAFGTPLYALLFYGLPGWNQLHSPFRWIFPYTLSLSVLAGLGLSYLQSRLTINNEQLAINNELPSNSPILQSSNPSALLRTSLPAFQPSSLPLFLPWLLLTTGLLGTAILLAALLWPSPFIQIASVVFERSGLAQNAFADGRQFFGYQWPNLLKFCLMLAASGAVLRLALGREQKSSDPSQPRRASTPRLRWEWLAVCLVSADLVLAGYGFNPAVDPALLEFKPPVVAWLEQQQTEDPLFRLTSYDTPAGRGNKVFNANAGMYFNLFDVRGYDSIIPGAYVQFMQYIQANNDMLFNRVGPVYNTNPASLDSALLDLLGVRYVLTTEAISNPNYELVYEQEIRVYANTDALPRAFLVPEAVKPADFNKPEAYEAMPEMEYALRSLNPGHQVILDGQTNGLGRDLTPADAARPPGEPGVTVTAYTPNEVRLVAHVDQPTWLVLADTYFPGWRAYASQLTINNEQLAINNEQLAKNLTLQPSNLPETELTIHRANGTFRAVYLPPGEWQGRFRYSPRSVQLGLYTSFLALALLAFLLGSWAWGKLYRESEDDSPIKRVAKNSLVPMVMALSNRLIDFAFALLMLRILQPEGAGQYAFAVAFIGLVEIFTRYGLGTLVTRDVAANRAESNRYLANASILRLYLWLAALPLMALVLALYGWFGDTTTEVMITIAIFAVGTFFSNLSDGLTALFYAHEKAEYPAGVSAITTLVRVSVGALVLLLGWGIIGLAGASLLANLTAFAVLSYVLVNKIYRPYLESDPGLQKEMMGQSFPLMINHLLSTIFFRIDVFILKPTWGSAQVGYYSAAYKYIDGINVIPQYFTLAIFPLMSRFAADSRDSLMRAYRLSLRLLLIMAIPLAVGTPFIAEELIWFLAGERFLPDSVIVLQLLIWFLPFSFINQVTQYVLIAIHQQKQLTKAFIIGVVFNTVTNLIFIPLYGYRAAAITTVLSEWSLLIPFYLMVRKNLGVVPWFDIAWRPGVAGAVMGGVLWLAGDLNFIATLSLGGLTYVVTLAAIGGLSQPDMAVLWRALPLAKLRQRLRRGAVQSK